MGAMRIHGASTAKVDLHAEWTDPVDVPGTPAPGESGFQRAGRRAAAAPAARRVSVRQGHRLPRRSATTTPRTTRSPWSAAATRPSKAALYDQSFGDAAPRHLLGDTKRHQVRYTAVATSRYREYFPQDAGSRLHALERAGARRRAGLGAAAGARRRLRRADVRLAAPDRHEPEAQRALRRRPARLSAAPVVLVGRRASCWAWRSGAARTARSNDATRDKFKPFFTQWGMDPIWQTAGLSLRAGRLQLPRRRRQRLRRVARGGERAELGDGSPGRVDVVGFAPQFDEERGLWFADLTIDLGPRPTRRSCAWRSSATSRTRWTMRASRAWCWPTSRSSRRIARRWSRPTRTTRARCAWW